MAPPSARPQGRKSSGAENFRDDIADRQKASTSPASDELLRAIFNTSAVGVAVLSVDARFLRVNEAFCSLTGYSAAELLTLDCFALTHPDDSTLVRAQFAPLLSGEIETLVLEQRYFRKNGEMIWVQNSLSLARNAENRSANIIAISQDITERKESEEVLRASKVQIAAELADTELLRDLSAQLIEQGDEQALHEKIVEVIAVIMRSDFATMQMFYPKRGPKGELHLLASRGLTHEAQNLWEWVTFETDSICGHALRTGTRAVAPDVETSKFLKGTPGRAALLEAGIRAVQSTPLLSRSGKFMGMVSSHWRQPHTPSDRDLRLLDILARQAADLIERKRAEEDLRRLNHDLEQFAYSASHDLQEPLRTIMVYSELLMERCGGELKGEPAIYLDFLSSAATRMDMLIRDLLAYAEVDKQPAPAKKVDARVALDNALANLEGAIEESSARISFDSLPAVRVDEMHLRQLFQNIIGNAVKYRHPDRPCTIHMSAEQRDGFWVFSARDNGIGIEPQYREQIFGLFTRLHGKDSHSGTGLGLAICKRIVERYHGRMWVESESGMGSDFRFTLPL